MQNWPRAAGVTTSAAAGDTLRRIASQTKGAADGSAAPHRFQRMVYFRLVIAVRSAESLTMPAAPHQLEPKPPGLVGVMKLGLKFLVE